MTSPDHSRWRRLFRHINGLFIGIVLLPTLLATAYYATVASDIYISESRFVVRSPQRPMQTGLGALLSGTAFSRSQDDTYSVHDYIRSRDALHELDGRLKVREAYASGDIDMLHRFPGITPWDESFEALHDHYLKHVLIDYDTVSSISVLRVRAYTAEQAQKINAQLLEMGERLVNTMNMRSRQDLIQVAEQEAAVAERRSKEAAGALSAFRSERSVFDPDKQSAMQLEAVTRLRQELLTAEAQLDQMKRISPGNPQVPNLQANADRLRKTVAEESARVLSREGGLSAKSPAYDRLILERGFADRQLAAALTALDTARSEAARKQLYLERLVQPHVPDHAAEPRRIRAVFTVLVVGLVLWGIVSLVLASVREHTD